MARSLRRRDPRSERGQTMVEFALAAPLFFLVLIGIIVLGIIVFYNQQLANAAREAARYASIHSASAQCPTVPNLDPQPGTDAITGATSVAPRPLSYFRCDEPDDGWPLMTAFARSKVFGLDPAGVVFSACWSGYRTTGHYDEPPPGTYPVLGEVDSQWAQCTIGGADPTANADAIACGSGLGRVDTASAASDGGSENRTVANRVTVFACYVWSPPAAGFLLIPQTVTLRAVISQPIERQQ